MHCSIADEASSFNIDIDGLWKRARPTTIAGIQVLVLSPEDLLLHLCLHMVYHHLFERGLISLCDIWETLPHYQDQIEWEQVRHRAHQWGTSKSVYLTLYLAKSFFGATVPQEVLDTLKPEKFDPQVVTWAKEQILGEFDKSVVYPIELLQFWKSKSSLEKLNILLKRVFPSPKEMAKMYHVPPDSPRLYLYYPVRLKEVLLRHGRKALRLLRRDKERVNLVERQVGLRDWLSR
ncbi:hypothetical protein THIOM_001124 [Candidatus Thiomargarita nelsonii]|uniref:Uncharacterized protein n=1 Tax=Candidatus Thiomargarita nelsonii TaxID=1003181 RepID=A0A176S4K5_9GAMM|nr:hypothetical protein THIOM_001124 [Candidatus Thiomargarita nelsonii]